MKIVAISLVLRADEIPADSPNLIVFPEGISWNQIHFAVPLLREPGRASTRGNFFVCPQIWDRIGLKEATSACILQACTSSPATIRTFTKSGARVLSLTRLAARSNIQENHEPIHV